jgi:hypothetical protein
MVARDRTTLGIALAVAGIAVMGREFPWIAIPLELFAIFLIIWGREGRRTEAFIGRLPAGGYMLKVLEQLDLILSPRDRDYEQQIRMVITGYRDDLRMALRILWTTRNPNNITSQQWDQFFRDCLVDSPSNNRGSMKAELRDIVGRVLDELGA